MDESSGRRQKWERRLHVAAVHHEVKRNGGDKTGEPETTVAS